MLLESTLIRSASWAITWDASAARHVYRLDVDVAFAGDSVTLVGRWEGPLPARVIDGRGKLVMPGLVNIHCHSADEAASKGLMEDVGTAALHGNQLYTYSQLLDLGSEGLGPCTDVTLAELLLSGCTTVVDLSGAYDGWLERLVASGIRAFAGPLYRQARWRAADWHRLEYEWDEPAGWAKLEAAMMVVDEALAHPCPRLGAIVAPSQVDTCRADLLRASLAAARGRGLKLTVHAAQTMSELEEMVRRHGTTSIAWLEAERLLTADLIIGHGIYLDHHRWTRFRTADDLGRLAAHGTTVAHCPMTFARTGMTLDTLGRYRRAGVPLGIGTDTWPFNMLEEMRQAILAARITSGDVDDVATGDVFQMATVGGADALGRPDLGRLVVGAKADLVIVDLAHPQMRPMHDPLRSLIHAAAERAVTDVFVDGAQVVRDGKLSTIDLPAAAAALEEARAKAIERIPLADPWRRELATIAPRSLPIQ